MLTSARGCHSPRLRTTAAVLAASPLSTMRMYTSSGLAACSPPPHRSPALARVGWYPDRIAPSWVGPSLPPFIFRDFCAHGPRMRIDDLSAPAGSSSPVFLLLSVPVMTALAARHLGLPPARVHSGFRGALRDYSARFTPADPYAPIGGFSALPPTGRISTWTRRETAAAAGAAQPAVEHGFWTRQGAADVFLSGRPSAARSAPSAAVGCRPERVSNPNACPDSTHPV